MEAKEVTSVLSIFTNLETFVAFVAFVVPGFISLRVYEALRGGEARKFNEVLIDVVMYSFATDIVALPVLRALLGLPDGGWKSLFIVLWSVLGFVLLPGGLAYAWFNVQRRLAKSGLLTDPTPKPWDKFFQRIAADKMDVGVIVTLSDGSKLGGRYVDPGFSSSAPADEQIHVGEAWLVDKITGEFKERIDGTLGFLIDKKDCLVVEFYEWSSIEQALSKA